MRMLVVTVCETMEYAVFKVNSPNQTVLTGRNNNRLMPPHSVPSIRSANRPGSGKTAKTKRETWNKD